MINRVLVYHILDKLIPPICCEISNNYHHRSENYGGEIGGKVQYTSRGGGGSNHMS